MWKKNPRLRWTETNGLIINENENDQAFQLNILGSG